MTIVTAIRPAGVMIPERVQKNTEGLKETGLTGMYTAVTEPEATAIRLKDPQGQPIKTDAVIIPVAAENLKLLPRDTVRHCIREAALIHLHQEVLIIVAAEAEVLAATVQAAASEVAVQVAGALTHTAPVAAFLPVAVLHQEVPPPALQDAVVFQEEDKKRK